MHFGDRELGCVGMVSMLPDMALVATGMALAFKTARRAAGGDDLLRRGLDRQRPVARGDELRRRPPAAGRLRAREQRLRLLDPERARVRGRPGRARGDLRLPRRARRRQRRRGGVRGLARRRRARPRGRRPDADRVPDDAHARPRRPRRHELRARRRCARSGPSATRSSATPSGWSPSTASPPTRSSGSAPRSRPTSTSAPQKALASPMPDPAIATEGVFADDVDPARRRAGARGRTGPSASAERSAA